MNVSALFFPAQAELTPGESGTVTLQLQNTTVDQQLVTLDTAGDLADHVTLSTERVVLEPMEGFEVPILVDPSLAVPAGPHEIQIEVTIGDETTTATARIDVAEFSGYTGRLDPIRSRSSKAGRHEVVVENTGNTPIAVDLLTRSGPEVVAELAAPTVIVEPANTAKVELRLTPYARKWSGAPDDHAFSVDLIGAVGGTQLTLDGQYEQTARVPAWFGPALAGMLGALLVGLVAWFLLLRPAVENIAEERAGELDAEQQAALDEQVAAIEAAAAEASELPLGEPTDLRLTVSAPAGSEATEAFDFDRSNTGRTLAISDIIFQNPTGAVGAVEFLRDGEVLLAQEMANFRDLDFHLVAPFRVDSGSSIALRVVCTTPGPTTADCEVAATVIGFVDEG